MYRSECILGIDRTVSQLTEGIFLMWNVKWVYLHPYFIYLFLKMEYCFLYIYNTFQIW